MTFPVNKITKCLVPVSGGKDSQTCLKLAIAKFGKDNVTGFFCDTKFEHPATYEHIENLKKWYDVEIITRSDGDVLSQCRKNKRFPSDIARFCTNTLKIRLTKLFCKQLAEHQKSGFEVWYGMRRDESYARAIRYQDNIDDELYEPHVLLPSSYPQYLAKKYGVMFRLPICSWTKGEVIDFLGDEINPLYAHGFDRVGCFPCLAGGDKYKELAFNFDDFGRQQREKIRVVEKELGKSVFTSKKGLRNDKQGNLCFICHL